MLREDLPPLQKEIIKQLAVNGAQLRSQVEKKLKAKKVGTHKGVLEAFSSLEAKGLIEKISEKEYRGRKFSVYWLRIPGIFHALMLKVDPELLRKYALETLKDSDGVNYEPNLFFDMAKVVPAEKLFALYILLGGSKKNGYGSFSKLHVFSGEDFRKMIQVLRKYPPYWEKLNETLRGVLTE
jgi:hypothetical protein